MTRPIICPTITAFNPHDYRAQIEKVSGLAGRLHIDLMDGDFAPSHSPALQRIWWPGETIADIHLMYRHPMEYLAELIRLRPHMVIIHNEAAVHHMHFAAELHKEGIEAGLAILQETPVEYAYQIMHSFDQVLIFSGQLGYHGGVADLGLLDKVAKVRAHHPDAEIAWDGGINADNIAELARAGVNVLNVGSYIQKSPHPQKAYDTLGAVVD